MDGFADIAAEGEPEEGDTGPLRLLPIGDDRNERLDKFVSRKLSDLSRSYVQQLIDAGNVQVDGVPRKRTFKLTPGEVVTVDLPEPAVEEIEPESIQLAIVYEDQDVLVIDKPAGMVVHPSPGHFHGTVVNAVLAHAPEVAVAGSHRPGIVHRIDKDTSGLLVIAKSDRGRTALVEQWQRHAVQKGYTALVKGIIDDENATIDIPIGRDPVQRNRMAAIASGRPAVTRFRVRERLATTTLLDLEIETGRTHQIRVHLAYIGHPIVGDSVYNRSIGPTGGAKSLAPRQFLHAARLAFTLPGGRAVAFESPLPFDLVHALAAARAEESKP